MQSDSISKKCEHCGAPITRRRFCSKRCAYGGEFREEYLYRMLSTASPDPLSPCLEWPYGTDSGGYGHFGVDGRLEAVHRLAYEYANGKLLDGECALHRCDNPPCFLPAHLFKGSKADNNADKTAKGRARHDAVPGMTKLTAEQTLEIRRRWIPNNNSSELAKEFGVSRTHLFKVAIGEARTMVDGGAPNGYVKKPKKLLTEEQKNSIRERYVPYSNNSELAKEYGVDRCTIKRLGRKKR